MLLLARLLRVVRRPVALLSGLFLYFLMLHMMLKVKDKSRCVQGTKEDCQRLQSDDECNDLSSFLFYEQSADPKGFS
jgi:hypothetical protein